MKHKKDTSGFVFFSKEEIDKQYDNVVKDCHNVESYEEVKKILHIGFYNKMFMAQKYEEDIGTIKVYRVTTEYEGFDPINPSCFSYPPNPSRGRANLKGYPVFYCSFNPTVSLLEMKDDFNPDTIYYVSEWEIVFKGDTLCHPLLYNSKTSLSDFSTANHAKDMMDRFIANTVLHKISDDNKESLKHLLTKLGDLFTLPTSDYYNITSAYAHNLLYELKEQDFDISLLMYPSVTSEHKGVNLAIHPNFVNSKMRLKTISRIRVTSYSEIKTGISLISAGLPISDKIDWYHPSIDNIEMDYQGFELLIKDGSVIKGFDALNLSINNSTATVKDVLHEVFEDNKKKLPMPELGRFGSLFPFEEKTHEVMFSQTFNDSLLIETTNGFSSIEKLNIGIRYTYNLEKYPPETFNGISQGI